MAGASVPLNENEVQNVVSGLGPNYAESCQRIKYSGYMRLPGSPTFRRVMDISRREISLSLFAFQRNVSTALTVSLLFFLSDLPISPHYELTLDGRGRGEKSSEDFSTRIGARYSIFV